MVNGSNDSAPRKAPKQIILAQKEGERRRQTHGDCSYDCRVDTCSGQKIELQHESQLRTGRGRGSSGCAMGICHYSKVAPAQRAIRTRPTRSARRLAVLLLSCFKRLLRCLKSLISRICDAAA